MSYIEEQAKIATENCPCDDVCEQTYYHMGYIKGANDMLDHEIQIVCNFARTKYKNWWSESIEKELIEAMKK